MYTSTSVMFCSGAVASGKRRAEDTRDTITAPTFRSDTHNQKIAQLTGLCAPPTPPLHDMGVILVETL